MQFLHFLAASCTPSGGGLLGLPKWYKYLPGVTETDKHGNTLCAPHISGISDVWLIGAAVLEILLRVSVVLAIGFIVFGGVKYITSQGQPDQTAVALRTIINAIAGLVIAIASAALVSFVAGRFN